MNERLAALCILIGTALAQILITIAFRRGYASVMHESMAGRVKMPNGYREMFAALLCVITGNVGTIMSFWFLRQRPTGKSTDGYLMADPCRPCRLWWGI